MAGLLAIVPLLLLPACKDMPHPPPAAATQPAQAIAQVPVRAESTLLPQDRTPVEVDQPALGTPHENWVLAGATRGTGRFGGSYFVSEGQLILRFDSLGAPGNNGEATRFQLDSLVADSVRTNEQIASECQVPGHHADGSIVGILTGPEWVEVRPRRAWLLDVAALRIRPISTDSVHCTILEALE